MRAFEGAKSSEARNGVRKLRDWRLLGRNIKLGRAVRVGRQARQLSHEVLGGIESGERNVGVKALFCIAKAFGAHPAELLAPCSFDWAKTR